MKLTVILTATELKDLSHTRVNVKDFYPRRFRAISVPHIDSATFISIQLSANVLRAKLEEERALLKAKIH